MLLHVISAAMLLNWGVFSAPAQTVDQVSVGTYAYASTFAIEDEISQECLDQIFEEAAQEWNSTPEQMEIEYIAGILTVTEIRPDTYEVSRGGDIMISICTGHGS